MIVRLKKVKRDMDIIPSDLATYGNEAKNSFGRLTGDYSVCSVTVMVIPVIFSIFIVKEIVIIIVVEIFCILVFPRREFIFLFNIVGAVVITIAGRLVVFLCALSPPLL